MTSRASELRCLLILPSEHEAVTVLRAYFDESGHTNDPAVSVVSVGGAIAPIEAWDALSDDWREVLRHFCISEFHMKDFAHSVGEFTGWPEPRRRMLLSSLMEVMDREITAYIGATVSLRIYSKVAGDTRAFLRDPYYGCFMRCLIGSDFCAKRAGTDEPVELVVANHPEFSGTALEVFNVVKAGGDVEISGERLGSISFGSPKEVVQLQAADLVAYELRQAVTHRARNTGRDLRWAMKRISTKGGYMKHISFKGVEGKL